MTQFEQYIKLNKKIPPEVLTSVKQIEDTAKLADTIASHLAVKISEKQELLELDSIWKGWKKFTPIWKGKSGFFR